MQRKVDMKTIQLRRFFQGSLLLLATITAALLPSTVLAQGVPIQGAFAVTGAVLPNTGSPQNVYCGGEPLALTVEAHGNGFTSLGPLSFSLLKTVAVPNESANPIHGCLTLTALNGDALYATYDGTESVPNANGFITGSGTLAFTGGTGIFKIKSAGGTAKFTYVLVGINAPDSFLNGTTSSPPSPLYFSAYYEVQGKVLLRP